MNTTGLPDRSRRISPAASLPRTGAICIRPTASARLARRWPAMQPKPMEHLWNVQRDPADGRPGRFDHRHAASDPPAAIGHPDAKDQSNRRPLGRGDRGEPAHRRRGIRGGPMLSHGRSPTLSDLVTSAVRKKSMCNLRPSPVFRTRQSSSMPACLRKRRKESPR